MIKVNEAREMVENHNKHVEEAMLREVEKFCENKVSEMIQLAAEKGNTSIIIKEKCSLEIKNKIVEYLIKVGGYEAFVVGFDAIEIRW